MDQNLKKQLVDQMDLMNLMERNNFVEHGTSGSNGKKNISSQKHPRLPGEASYTLHPCRELTGVIHGCKIPRTQQGWFLIQHKNLLCHVRLCQFLGASLKLSKLSVLAW